jgi:hypothetical protein
MEVLDWGVAHVARYGVRSRDNLCVEIKLDLNRRRAIHAFYRCGVSVRRNRSSVKFCWALWPGNISGIKVGPSAPSYRVGVGLTEQTNRVKQYLQARNRPPRRCL